MKADKVRTTISLPVELLAEADRIIKEGIVDSRNSLFARALKKEIAAIERAKIDSALAEMAQDAEYQKEVMLMEAEFASASWEATLTEEERNEEKFILLDSSQLKVQKKEEHALL